MPPIIGLTTQGYQEKVSISKHYDHYFSVPKEYIDSVLRAGGIPVLIPSYDNNWQALWSTLDGVIVTGGTDVSPAHYNADPNNPAVHADAAERDLSELSLIQHAITADTKPILCVCRGVQVLNVALGGTLHAHIPDIRDEDIHRNAEGTWTTHDCHVETGSQLAHIMQSDLVHTYSGHHQALDKIGDGLQVVSTAPDGIVEAIIGTNHPWLVGVQWHPEKTTDSDPTQQRLFDELVKVAQQ